MGRESDGEAVSKASTDGGAKMVEERNNGVSFSLASCLDRKLELLFDVK